MSRRLVGLGTAAIGVAAYLHRTRWLELATARGAGAWDPFVLDALIWAGAAMGLWLAGLACARLPEDLDVAHVRARGLVWVAATLATCAVWAALLPAAISGIHWAVADWGRAAEGSLMALALFPASALMAAPMPWIAQALSRTPREPGGAFSRVLAAFFAGIAVAALGPELLGEAGFGLRGGVWWVSILQLATAAGFAGLGLLADWRSPRRASESRALADPAVGLGATVLAAAVLGFGLALAGDVLQRIAAILLGGGPLVESVAVAAVAAGLALGAAALARGERRLRAQLPVVLGIAAAALAALGLAVPDAAYRAHYLRVVFADEAASYVPFHVAVALCGAVLLVPLTAPLGSVPASLVAVFEREDWAAGRRLATVLAWIAAGAALGAVAGGPLWIPRLTLQGALALCVLLLAAGTAWASARRPGRARGVGLAVAVAVAGVALLTPRWPAERLLLGLSGQRRPLPESFEGAEAFFERTLRHSDRVIRYARHGRSHTVAVAQLAGARRSLVVDGDAGIALPLQEKGLTLLSLLPVWLADAPSRALVIGDPTGLVARRMAAVPGIVHVELSLGAPELLGAGEAFEDLLPPGSAAVHYRLGDTRRWLQRSPDRYHAIAVAPHAWWTRDAVRLLDQEALRHAYDHLEPGGVYVHWMPRWGADVRVLRRFLATMRQSFDAVSLWKVRRSEWIVVGFKRGGTVAPRPGHFTTAHLAERFAIPEIRRPLWQQGIRSLPELLAHESLPVGVVGRVRLPNRIRVTDQPRVRRLAARGYFAGGVADPPPSFRGEAAHRGARNSLLRQYERERGGALSDRERTAISRALCEIDASACIAHLLAWRRAAPEGQAMRDAWGQARYEGRLDGLRLDLLSALMLPGPAAERKPTYANAIGLLTQFETHYAHAAPLDAGLLQDLWRRCAERDDRCAEELDRVADLGPRAVP